MWPEADRWRAPVGDFPPPWASAWGDDPHGLWAEFTVNGVTQRLRWIEPTGPEGFWMGSTQIERDAIRDVDKASEERLRDWANQTEAPRRRVRIGQGFWLADTPCTQALWLAVLGGDNPSQFKSGADAAERPVEQVNWDDDIPRFLRGLGETLAAAPVLPTETEWEWACRAGSTTAYWWGDEADTARANIAQSVGETTPVKRYPANPWGLYDMHGNVWEWCADAWQDNLTRPEAGAERPGAPRVVRGGSWLLSADWARSASRYSWLPDFRWPYLGFRLALRSQVPGGPGA